MSSSSTVSAGADIVVADLNNLRKDVLDGSLNYSAAAGSSSAYTVTLSQLSTYSAGLRVVFKANHANTGSSTLNINGWGAKTIKIFNDQDLTANDIESGQIVSVIYDGVNFEIPRGGDMSREDIDILTGGVASDAATLHTHNGDSIKVVEISASDTLQESADTVQQLPEAGYTIKKSIKINRKGTVRVKFDLRRSSTEAATAYGATYKNGVLQEEFTNTTDSFVTKTDTSLAVDIGDCVQGFIKISGTATSVEIRNFRVYFTVSEVEDAVVSID